jgi:hypothetical protein
MGIGVPFSTGIVRAKSAGARKREKEEGARKAEDRQASKSVASDVDHHDVGDGGRKVNEATVRQLSLHGFQD